MRITSSSSRTGELAVPLPRGRRSDPRRIKLEEDYIHGLKKLYSRSKAVDTLHDE
jgi:hypothetical protein